MTNTERKSKIDDLQAEIHKCIKNKYSCRQKMSNMGRKERILPPNFELCLLRWYNSNQTKPYTLETFALDVGIPRMTLIQTIKRYELRV